ncbi:uncharacterized protein LAESUDRAFT_813743 [Laetiporus sulphureus 93-53]|uniref:Uncharacterized protein n=1 Tax=Laetiporus sulphureus 93-53 TaxID=1314785 RepID=A0A165DLI4_9APHY|nr:uncharacterized protein LAESUDRAFT_813743 [Laetiporus sulphureus 93-53]KZT05148.1 hypothetical protein LAESUDRAFT_813743 [Laetiporus sulphureus 93-53]
MKPDRDHEEQPPGRSWIAITRSNYPGLLRRTSCILHDVSLLYAPRPSRRSASSRLSSLAPHPTVTHPGPSTCSLQPPTTSCYSPWRSMRLRPPAIVILCLSRSSTSIVSRWSRPASHRQSRFVATTVVSDAQRSVVRKRPHEHPDRDGPSSLTPTSVRACASLIEQDKPNGASLPISYSPRKPSAHSTCTLATDACALRYLQVNTRAHGPCIAQRCTACISSPVSPLFADRHIVFHTADVRGCMPSADRRCVSRHLVSTILASYAAHLEPLLDHLQPEHTTCGSTLTCLQALRVRTGRLDQPCYDTLAQANRDRRGPPDCKTLRTLITSSYTNTDASQGHSNRWEGGKYIR